MPNPFYREGIAALTTAISNAEEYEWIFSIYLAKIKEPIKSDCPFDKLMELAVKVISIEQAVTRHISDTKKAVALLNSSWSKLKPLTDSLVSSYRESLSALAKQIALIPSEKWPNEYRLQWERVKKIEGNIDNKTGWDCISEVLHALPYEENT